MVLLQTISSLATFTVFRTRVDETNGYLTAADVQYFLAWARQRIGQLSESKVGITTEIYIVPRSMLTLAIEIQSPTSPEFQQAATHRTYQDHSRQPRGERTRP